MKRLGAIIAGGKSTRFGSDKGAAILNNKPLIQHVADGLQDQVDQIIICGRQWPSLESVVDRPEANLGPLGGINAALHFAQKNGFDTVITAGCDVLPIPDFPADMPNDKAAYIAGHYVFGIWPVILSTKLDAYLGEQSDRSMRNWIKTIAAQELPKMEEYQNFNTPENLDEYTKNGMTML
jgi:molybdenum cofactor guanylyltransferase